MKWRGTGGVVVQWRGTGEVGQVKWWFSGGDRWSGDRWSGDR